MLYLFVNAMSYCIVGVLNACDVCITQVFTVISGWLFMKILVSVGVTNAGTSSCLIPIIRPLNKFWQDIPAELLVNWTCTSLAVAPFELFPTSFIVKFATLLIIFSDVIHCQICDFADYIVSDIVYCKICDFVY